MRSPNPSLCANLLHTQDENKIVSILEKPHGIVLVTGPTGSGKSTSLTAFIRKIHKPERRIMTVEDPVEYEVSGVNQTQVNSEIGFPLPVHCGNTQARPRCHNGGRNPGPGNC